MKRKEFDVIAIGAHPDDVEVGTGGVMIKLHQLGYRTGLVSLTRGEMGTGGTAAIRRKETRRGAAILGAQLLATLNFGDCKLVDSFTNRLKVARLLRKFRPRVVLAPFWDGGHGKRQGHPDHLACGRIVMNAVNFAGLKKMPLREEPHQVKALFHYFLPAGLMPTFVVDITAEFPRWREALKAHRSQFLNPEKSLDYLWFLESMARTYGNYIRTRYGQGFVIGEPFKIDDLTLLAG